MERTLRELPQAVGAGSNHLTISISKYLVQSSNRSTSLKNLWGTFGVCMPVCIPWVSHIYCFSCSGWNEFWTNTLKLYNNWTGKKQNKTQHIMTTYWLADYWDLILVIRHVLRAAIVILGFTPKRTKYINYLNVIVQWKFIVVQK